MHNGNVFPLGNYSVMHYITEMHVMPITFQLLLHYNKFFAGGSFQDFTASNHNYIGAAVV